MTMATCRHFLSPLPAFPTQRNTIAGMKKGKVVSLLFPRFSANRKTIGKGSDASEKMSLNDVLENFHVAT